MYLSAVDLVFQLILSNILKKLPKLILKSILNVQV